MKLIRAYRPDRTVPRDPRHSASPVTLNLCLGQRGQGQHGAAFLRHFRPRQLPRCCRSLLETLIVGRLDMGRVNPHNSLPPSLQPEMILPSRQFPPVLTHPRTPFLWPFLLELTSRFSTSPVPAVTPLQEQDRSSRLRTASCPVPTGSGTCLRACVRACVMTAVTSCVFKCPVNTITDPIPPYNHC
jgi:hypothetical protein